MRVPYIAAILVAFVFSACSSTGVVQVDLTPIPKELPFSPSEEKPVHVCATLCSDGSEPGFSFQHLCKSGASRQWRNLELIGEIADHWIYCADWFFDRNVMRPVCKLGGEISKQFVDVGNCKDVVRRLQDALPAEHRLEIQPGEDRFGNSLNPPSQ